MLPFPIKNCPVELFTRATPGSSLVSNIADQHEAFLFHIKWTIPITGIRNPFLEWMHLGNKSRSMVSEMVYTIECNSILHGNQIEKVTSAQWVNTRWIRGHLPTIIRKTLRKTVSIGLRISRPTVHKTHLRSYDVGIRQAFNNIGRWKN